MSPATPYNLLGSKAEVLRRIVREDIRRFVQELEGHAGETPLQSLLSAADLLVGHYEGDRRLHVGVFHAAFTTPEVRGVLSCESVAWWNGLVQAATDSGELSGAVHPRQLTQVLLRMMAGVVQGWLAAGWTANRFALEMSLAARLVLASACAPRSREATLREPADLQASIDAHLTAEGSEAADKRSTTPQR